MRKTHLTAHTASAWALRVSLGERLQSTFFKILALARNASLAEMSAWLCPGHRMVLLRLPFEDDITQPLPCTLRMVHRTDEIPSLTQPNGTGFSSQSRDFTNRISTLPLGPPPLPPPSQNHSYSEPATLGVQVNPWSVPGVRRVMATSLQHSRSRSEPPPLQWLQVGSDCGWLEDEFITCLTAQLTAHLAEPAGVR